MMASHLKTTEVEAKLETKFEVFTAVKIRVEVSWVFRFYSLQCIVEVSKCM